MTGKQKAGFTLVEILMVVALIGILSTIVLVMVSKSRDRAAIKSYLSAMQSLRTGVEICFTGSTPISSGKAGDAVCAGKELYPAISNSCGASEQPIFVVSGSANYWTVESLKSDGSQWSCKDCAIACNINQCDLSAGC
ncbi:type II secretion system protein [Patescibacteria group bacterium]|nr:MAG: type II secretion system protein [Patescibacteria group bacterium]